MNNSKTGQELPQRAVIEHMGQEDHTKVMGTMADREVMAHRLSKELGFNHLPEAQKKIVNGQEMTLTEDVHQTYTKDFKEIHSDMGACMGGELGRHIFGMIEKDPRLHDKIALDFIMGNTDRHGGNMFVGEGHNGEMTMLGIDHGLSFPNDNKKYIEGANINKEACAKDFFNQYDFFKMLDYNKVTRGFYDHLTN